MSPLSDSALRELLLASYEEPPYSQEQATLAAARMAQTMAKHRERRVRQVLFLIAFGVGSPLLLVGITFIRFLLNLLGHLGLAARDSALSAMHAAPSTAPASEVLAVVFMLVACTLIITGVRMANVHG